MSHRATTILILLAALVLYFTGHAAGSAVLFAGGIVLELWFWVRLFRGRRSSS